MDNTEPKTSGNVYFTIDIFIKLVVISLLVIATLRIIKPFLMPVAWGVIIAVASEPFVRRVAKFLGNRKKLASTLFALTLIAGLVIPSAMMFSSSVSLLQSLSTQIERETLIVPAPPKQVESWPIIGEATYQAWELASSNLDAALHKFGPQLKDGAELLLTTLGGGIKDVLMFIISIAIAGALLATAEAGSRTAAKIINRFAGGKGGELQALATATIRGVMQGVIGVAVIQAVLSAIGMVLVGVPAAGLWAALVLILAIIQLPPVLVLGPIAAWVFSFAETLPAVLFLIWALVVSGCDGILKPVLMGRGVDAPMLVILVGALGGMMLSGIIGLFVGAVIVAVSYTVFMSWVEDGRVEESSPDQ